MAGVALCLQWAITCCTSLITWQTVCSVAVLSIWTYWTACSICLLAVTVVADVALCSTGAAVKAAYVALIAKMVGLGTFVLTLRTVSIAGCRIVSKIVDG